MRLTGLLFFALYFLSTTSFGEDGQKPNFNDYSSKAAALNSRCASKGMFGFSGFCLSTEYGKPSFNNPNQTSINLGVEIASLEYFYAKCEHSNFPSLGNMLAKSKGVLDANKYTDEINPQIDALENYVGYFHACKTVTENDLNIQNKQKWFDYMIKKFASDRNENDQSKVVSSHKAATFVVDCILSKYHGGNNDFAAAGLLAKDGSIVVTLLAPMQQPLAIVKNIEGGSVTQYINVGFSQYKSTPHPEEFSNAIIQCQ